MKIKNNQMYENWKDNNKDGCGAYIFRYAERWADLMESKINQNVKLEDIAQTTSCDADTEGITGFMYGMAVSMLSECWEYGEALKQWHNKKYNYQGDKVVSPATISIN